MASVSPNRLPKSNKHLSAPAPKDKPIKPSKASAKGVGTLADMPLVRPKSNKHLLTSAPKDKPLKPSKVSANGVGTLADMPLVRPVEPELVEIGERYLHDPLGFVHDMFVWDTRELRGQQGPLRWQEEVLASVGYGLEEHSDVFRLAVASGKGAGKTALVAQLFIWHVTTRQHSQTTLTATTGRQIADRSWREVRKWIRLCKLYNWFMVQSTRLVHRTNDTWYGMHQTWSEERPEAFQGSHEEYVCFLVDEASGVPDTILETIETGLTDQHVFLGYFSNPTRSIGRFRQSFLGGMNAHLWETYNIDTRNVELVNKDRVKEILEECGNDEEASKFRINVRGEFALEDHDQVIPEWIVKAAQERQAEPLSDDPIIIGADIARKGLNKTVFIVRRGCQIVRKVIYAKQELDATADKLCELIDEMRQTYTQEPTVFVDADGFGIGVCDICKRMGYKVEEVHSGLMANDTSRFFNKRAEMWYEMREWLRTIGCLDPADKSLANQLMGVMFSHDLEGRIKLETKEEMLNRSFPSPDEADALVYGFARRVARGKVALGMHPDHYYSWPWNRGNGVPAHLGWMAH